MSRLKHLIIERLFKPPKVLCIFNTDVVVKSSKTCFKVKSTTNNKR